MAGGVEAALSRGDAEVEAMTAVAIDTERVWHEMHDSLHGFVRRRVREPADADDVVQRIFLQVHRALPTLRDPSRLQAWLFQTARRAIADHYRTPAYRRELPVGTTAEDLPDDARPVESDADEASALQELAGCLRPLLARLGTRDRDALRLIDVEGLTQVEAARRLGVSVSGMKSRVQRARGRFRTVIEACCRVELDRRGGVLSYEPRAAAACAGCEPASTPGTARGRQ